MKKLFLSVFAVVALVALVPSVHAFNMELDYRLSGTAPESEDSPWLEATFEDVESNRVRLKLESTNLTEGENVSEWYFNFNPDKAKLLSQLTFTFESSDDNVLDSPPTISTGSNTFQVDKAGSFDIKFGFSGFTGGQEVLFDLTMDGVTAADFDFLSTPDEGASRILSAAHVQGIGTANDSGWVSTPIPEPATMLLLGSGLVGFAGFRKRFRK